MYGLMKLVEIRWITFENLVINSVVEHQFITDTSKGTHVSLIVAMNSEGLLGYELLSGTTNGDTFFDFVRGTLITNMQQFPAVNFILILGNCSIHHVQQEKDLMTSVGILIDFLRPYSPDYKPSQELFSYVK
uniref:Tc1-like transposase DDE domain-containing protein n=1 Tax=Amphimedon queenslandica TaxID=400682 RepID=A0A1X7UMQ1_AMPQE